MSTTKVKNTESVEAVDTRKQMAVYISAKIYNRYKALAEEGRRNIRQQIELALEKQLEAGEGQ